MTTLTAMLLKLSKWEMGMNNTDLELKLFNVFLVVDSPIFIIVDSTLCTKTVSISS